MIGFQRIPLESVRILCPEPIGKDIERNPLKSDSFFPGFLVNFFIWIPSGKHLLVKMMTGFQGIHMESVGILYPESKGNDY